MKTITTELREDEWADLQELQQRFPRENRSALVRAALRHFFALPIKDVDEYVEWEWRSGRL